MDPTMDDTGRGIRSLMQEMADVAGYLWQKGWAERNSGNISVRMDGSPATALQLPSSPPAFDLPGRFPGLAGDTFLVTGAGCRMRDLSGDPAGNILLIRVTEGGERYEMLSPVPEAGSRLTPTSELASHLLIHDYLKTSDPEKKVVVHTHPTGLIALSHSPVYKEEEALNRALRAMLPETVILVPEGIGVVPYRPTGSMDLARASIGKLETHDVLLWEKHGCLAVAPTVAEAFDLIDVLSKSAAILLTCLSAGYDPEGISDSRVQELRRLFPRS